MEVAGILNTKWERESTSGKAAAADAAMRSLQGVGLLAKASPAAIGISACVVVIGMWVNQDWLWLSSRSIIDKNATYVKFRVAESSEMERTSK
jgi:hypothetical protein